MSLYSVLISFAHNLQYKMLWVCSSRPLESYISSVHGTAVSKMQQLWRINMATAKCVETTSEYHVHFAKHSPGEMKTRPSTAKNMTTTRNQNYCNELWHLYRSIHNGMKVNIMLLKTAIAHTSWVAVLVWMSFASSPSMYVSSFSPNGHPVNSVMILLQVPM